ncbi:LOW QUALITY PROTEIN: E3 ubiquitin-protein ligase RNF169 [Tachyglossus aculeatus]|uniref:LOW QUALITY PROTEIN: E3 ubiquitin-protein ligase RNF169 n=1 Tax=Tachyglossus aculeatus TaxID=9261 RepID=UPI0018F68C54|nr:LOW QUALITY PROTEIN: E3 ubiquitin-protein ligase RNF169 [Tachyglossus aculeatus]
MGHRFGLLMNIGRPFRLLMNMAPKMAAVAAVRRRGGRRARGEPVSVSCGPGPCGVPPGCPLCRPWPRQRHRRHRRGRRPRPRPRARPPERQGRLSPGAPAAEPADQEEFIFRAPIKLSKPGELREEYESQLRKLREEKVQEERAPDDLIHKLLLEDMEAGKRKMEEQPKNEPLPLKANQECCPDCLSDSENEEPAHGKAAHRSAFVSKSSTYSLTFLTGNLHSKMERSQSCNDTAPERGKSRLKRPPAKKTKVPAATPGSTPLAGVLLSTQNNRCLSAPDLWAASRPPLGSLSSTLHRPECSVSPESNDSISEELNHFKPIVCSPCTPPKRLPDGRVLSPLIIKSTPRNLSRTLQKQTTYEASPRILKKWEQIFQERQIKKTLSKATLTSSLAPEPGDDASAPDAPRPGPPGGRLFPATGQAGEERGSAETPPGSGPAGGRARANGAAARSRGLEGPGTDRPGPDPPGIPTAKTSGVGSGPPENDPPSPVVKTPAKTQAPALNPFELPFLPNGAHEEAGESLDGEALPPPPPPPPPRRGRKRHCKTKHLEQNGSLKKLRQAAGEAPPPGLDRRLRQEEEDRQLALQLQRFYDHEHRTVSGGRRKGPADQYLLRPKSSTGAK